jgi:aminocarboxymuconate-semialdehyde decarboxylase
VHTIDIHNHFYPEVYLREIARESRAASVVTMAGETRIVYGDDYSVVVAAHRDPAVRIADMDAAGIGMHVLSLPGPAVHCEAPGRGMALARLTNEALAGVVRAHPARLGALATLPMQAPQEAARELERAVRDLGLRGAMIFSNHGGVPLDDPRNFPVYEVAEALDVPLLVHPATPANAAGANLADYRLVALLAFPFDVTVAATRLILGGVLDRFPRLTFILGLLGGALPLLAERVARGYAAYPELRGTLRRPIADYFRRFYYDTVPNGAAGIPLTVAFAGADRVVLGSDHPHTIGNLRDCTAVIDRLEVSEEDRALMLGGNLARLLRLRQNSDAS